MNDEKEALALRDKTKRELADVERQIAKARDTLSFLGKQIEDDFSSKRNLIRETNQGIENLKSELGILSNEKAELSRQLELSKSIIVKFKQANDQLLLENQKLTREKFEIDTSLERKREVAKMESDKIVSEIDLANQRMAYAREQERIVLDKIAKIKDQLENNIEQSKSLEVDLERSRRELQNLKNREHNVKVMEQRLRPEYQEAFKRSRSRNKK